MTSGRHKKGINSLSIGGTSNESRGTLHTEPGVNIHHKLKKSSIFPTSAHLKITKPPLKK